MSDDALVVYIFQCASDDLFSVTRRKPPTSLMRTRLDTPGQIPSWRIRLDIVLHLARFVLDATDPAQQIRQCLR
jgi:hypothetical protein